MFWVLRTAAQWKDLPPAVRAIARPVPTFPAVSARRRYGRHFVGGRANTLGDSFLIRTKRLLHG
ncbi:MAG: hypothetical protein DMG97_10905 [Acidobacteria bacterium]|nr:MAG: hypothetical protein DME33_14690 [Verrucomicrobiota bacterium]PYV73603.1 MAG: hypothetical protein DMG97_10905 [Acidobacteriota bacterium]